MRITLVLLAVTLMTAALSPASAEHQRKRRPADQAHVQRPQRAIVDSAEHDRARGCDPAGQYAAYPDWARIAFSCGSGRR